MAEINYNGGAAPHTYTYENDVDTLVTGEASRVSQWVNWSGALVSMGLVIGMGVWAFQLLVRDVAEVPVIRALDGPMRVAPDNPGGAIAENQGLAVNRLAEGAEAAPVPDQLRIAPAPLDLTTVDLSSAPDETAEEERAFENASTALPDIDAEVVPVVAVEEDTETLIARLLEEAVPLTDMDAPVVDDSADVVADADAGIVTIPVSVPGVNRSLRPSIRPASLVVHRPAATEQPITEAVIDDGDGFELDAGELAAGTRLVQLGAYDTPDLARAQWQRLSGNFPDFFLGRARVIEAATSSGDTFYRLRAHGFADLSASRRFCAALVAQGAACIPVTVR